MLNNRIVRVTDKQLTIERKKYGRGFQYFWVSGEKLDCPRSLRRIKQLVIPPMWKDVKICELENGHIQAIGADLKARRQYIYHPQWQEKQQQKKFAKLAGFAEKLPEMRAFCHQQLEISGWPKEKVLALMVLVLDETGIRIGNKRYSEENETYGLSTLRRKHVDVENDNLFLRFTGKSGKQREIDIDDPALSEHIKQCATQPGYELFRYQGEGQTWHDVDSEDVNTFIDEHMGESYSCKDFRTWAATRLAYDVYPEACEEQRASPRKKLINIVLRKVGKKLGNTPTVCRKYYIHPKLLRAIENGSLDDQPAPQSEQSEFFSPSEAAVLNIIAS